MATINGCNLPEDLYYNIEKHTWAKPMDGNTVRIGMTTVAAKLSGGNLTGVTVSKRKIGKELKKGKSVAMVESSKFVGPVPAPVQGTLVRGNDKVAEDPSIAVSDPYGEGWIAEMEATDWETDKASLVTGADGLETYKAKLEEEGISCD